jgi:hypothetical protein
MNVVAHIPLQHDLHITEYDADGLVTPPSPTPPTIDVTVGYSFVDTSGPDVERVKGIKCLQLPDAPSNLTFTKTFTKDKFHISFWSKQDGV